MPGPAEGCRADRNPLPFQAAFAATRAGRLPNRICKDKATETAASARSGFPERSAAISGAPGRSGATAKTAPGTGGFPARGSEAGKVEPLREPARNSDFAILRKRFVYAIGIPGLRNTSRECQATNS